MVGLDNQADGRTSDDNIHEAVMLGGVLWQIYLENDARIFVSCQGSENRLVTDRKSRGSSDIDRARLVSKESP